MKNFKIFLISTVAFLCGIYSCSFEKRLYRTGYCISKQNNCLVKKHNHSKPEIANVNNEQKHKENITGNTYYIGKSEVETNVNPISTINLIASTTNDINTVFCYGNYHITPLKFEECDYIILNDGQEIKAKVLEVGNEEIKYKECSNINGPTFTINKSKVFKIKYPNEGTTIISSNSINEKKSPTTISIEDCDFIIKKNGQEIKAKVLDVGNDEIKYKECNNINGPTFTINKSEVFIIKYPNGTSTVISNTDTNSSKYNSSSVNNKKEGKSLLVAVLLWAFLGLLGIHRLYLGHIGMGILYLLTGGLCGIGWIIDGILFLTGDLKPKNGEYKE